MRALIFGGAGSIGSRLSAALVSRGDEVLSLDVSAEPVVPSDAFGQVDARIGSVQDAAVVDEVVAEFRPDVIFHLAAILSGLAETDSELAWRVNVDGTRNVLEAARRFGIGRVVFTSTVATYGAGLPEPITEDVPQWPAGLYGVTKVLGERLGVYYHQRFGLDFRAVRLAAMVAPTAPAGGAASAFVCDLFVNAVREGGYDLYVYPNTRVPIVWVDDVVGALQLLCDADEAKLSRRVYHIIGAGPSVQEMVDAVQARLPHARLRFEIDPVRADIVESWPSRMDDSAARADWGWEPRFDLERMTAANLDALGAPA
ncbi:MAG: NAD-dependent epimerase/dehydratase family protein [Chloroflexota bacterium]|nr:NAD-dependent epimerase/dehydratase family protein [Chloroflexota bacterium]